MRRRARIFLLAVAASSLGCGQAPAGAIGPSPAASDVAPTVSSRSLALPQPGTWNAPAGLAMSLLEGPQVGSASLASSAGLGSADRSVLAAGSQSTISQQFKQLADEVKKLDSRHQAAMSALIWQDIKDKTQQELLLQARQWNQHPDLALNYLTGIVDQVTAMSDQEASQVAKALPPGALQAASTGVTPTQPDRIPAALKSSYAALDKRISKLTPEQAKALVATIWQGVEDLTTQQVYAKQQDWKAHPEKQLAFLEQAVSRVETAGDQALKALIARTPDEIFQAAQQAAQMANQGQPQTSS